MMRLPLKKRIMQSFDDFISEIHTEYEQLFARYEQDS